MLDKNTVSIALESGGACLADIAEKFNLPLAEVFEFAADNGISEPLGSHQCHRSKQKLWAGERLNSKADQWERLLWDDDTGAVINGIDTMRTDGRINAVDIVTAYHGDCRCIVTDRPTQTVMAVDGNVNNILVSNLLPITEEQIHARGLHESFPMTVTKQYGFPVGTLHITLEARFDCLYGGCLKTEYLNALIVQWVAPYLRRKHIELPHGLPATPELVTLWLWRQLETKALIKGLARIQWECGDIRTSLVKHTLLVQTQQMIQRRLSSRSVMPASAAVQRPQHQPLQQPIILKP